MTTAAASPASAPTARNPGIPGLVVSVAVSAVTVVADATVVALVAVSAVTVVADMLVVAFVVDLAVTVVDCAVCLLCQAEHREVGDDIRNALVALA
jgi:hypothetical protein